MNDLYQGNDPHATLMSNTGSQYPNPPTGYGLPTAPPPPEPGMHASPPVAGQYGWPAEPGPPAPSGGSGGSKLVKVLVAVAVVAVLGLGGGVGYMVLSNDDKAADSAAPDVTDAPDVPDVTDAPDAPETPEAPEAPDATEAPEAPDESDATTPVGETSDQGAGTATEPRLPPAAKLPVPDSVPVDPDSLTETQQRAAAEAQKWNDFSPMSRKKLIAQLTNEENDEVFSEEDAIAGIDSLGIDWVAGAKYWAGSMIAEEDGHSRLGLLTTLTGTIGSGYTVDQATKAVDSMTIDWDAEAVKYATQYVDQFDTSRAYLMWTMVEEGSEDFTADQAAAAIDGLKVDWNAKAAKSAKSTLAANPGTGCEEMIEYLQDSSQMFEADQAEYGAKEAGIC